MADEFLFTRGAFIEQYDRQGQLVGTVNLTGYNDMGLTAFEFVPLPAPSGLALIGVGVLGVGARRRRI
jgi:hypothetical protein